MSPKKLWTTIGRRKTTTRLATPLTHTLTALLGEMRIALVALMGPSTSAGHHER
jgi:hypothetical protein